MHMLRVAETAARVSQCASMNACLVLSAVQVSLAQKDALLTQLAQQKAAMETRLGLTGVPFV